jgi:hypothetical protein
VVAAYPFHYYWALRCEFLIAAMLEAEAARGTVSRDGEEVEDIDIDANLGIKDR